MAQISSKILLQKKLVAKLEVKRPLGRLRHGCVNNMKIGLGDRMSDF
jgi:hypothetical protein